MTQITSTLFPQSSPSEWEERDISEALTGFSRHFPEFSCLHHNLINQVLSFATFEEVEGRKVAYLGSSAQKRLSLSVGRG